MTAAGGDLIHPVEEFASMPLYEYKCLKCENVVEVLQKLNDRPLRKCKLCSGKLEKLISRTSFQLKGGGWFAHGYGGDSSEKSSSSASEATSSDSSDKSDKSKSKSKSKKKTDSKESKPAG